MKSIGSFQKLRVRSASSIISIKFYYLLSILLSLKSIFYDWLPNKNFFLMPEPIWSVLWLEIIEGRYYFLIISFMLQFIFSILSAINPFHQLFRLGFALFLFINVSTHYSSGKVSHNLHLWVLTAIFFAFGKIFNCNNKRKLIENIRFLMGAQVICSLTYLLAGINKIFSGSIFNYNVAASHIMSRWISEEVPLTNFASFVLGYPDFLYISFLIVVVVQVLQFFMCFKVELNLPHGVLILFFHISTKLLLSILFFESLYVVLAIFICPGVFNWQNKRHLY